MQRRTHALFLLSPALLLLPLLFLDKSSLFGNTDALFYTLLMKLCGQQMLTGDFWPRWLMGADGGLGAPLMYYYPPLPYLLTALLTAPLSTFMSYGPRMVAGMYIATAASGYTAFFWLSSHFPRRAALPGALLYMLLPYRLIYIYLHFNLAQLWALVWLPLWMVACERMAAGHRRAIAEFALCTALVGYTHPLTLLAFGAVPAAYVFWLGGRQMLQPLFRSMALAAALIASYAVSFLTAHPWFIGNFTGGKYNLFNNLSHVDSSLLSYYLAIALMVFLLAGRKLVKTGWQFWALALLILWGMTLSLSAPLWHLLVPLQYLQFPAARLQAGMLVAVTFLAASFFAARKLKTPLPVYLRPPVFWLVIGIGVCATGWRIADTYRQVHSLPAAYVNMMQEHSVIPLPYRLKWSTMDAPRVLLDQPRLTAMSPVRVQIGLAKVMRWLPGSISMVVAVPGPMALVTVRQRYVPAWRVFDNSRGVPVTVSPWGEEGMIAFELPRGSHEIRLYLVESEWQLMADLLSFATLVSLLLKFRRSRA